MALPVTIPVIDSRGLIDYRWARALEQSFTVAESGTAFVTDLTSSSFGPSSIAQGLDSAKGTPNDGVIYFALDTRKIYVDIAGSWVSITDLEEVFASPGTYGASNLTPKLTINEFGQITNLAFEVITAEATAAGAENSLQYNSGGTLAGSSITVSGNGLVFADPVPTRTNLSPLTQKGDIWVRGSADTRLPVGTDNQVLVSDSSSATGLTWVTPDTVKIRFHYGDASPKPLITVPGTKVVRSVQVHILEAFDSSASLEIPDLIEPTDILASVPGVYGASPNFETSSTSFSLIITPGSSTSGAGALFITME